MKVDSALFCVTHPVVKVVDIGQDVCVRHHHALCLASRPACIDQSQNRVGIVNSLGIRKNAVSELEWILIEYLFER